MESMEGVACHQPVEGTKLQPGVVDVGASRSRRKFARWLTPYGRPLRQRPESANAYFQHLQSSEGDRLFLRELFDAISSGDKKDNPFRIRLAPFDLFHGHVIQGPLSDVFFEDEDVQSASPSSSSPGTISILFHAKEYPVEYSSGCVLLPVGHKDAGGDQDPRLGSDLSIGDADFSKRNFLYSPELDESRVFLIDVKHPDFVGAGGAGGRVQKGDEHAVREEVQVGCDVEKQAVDLLAEGVAGSQFCSVDERKVGPHQLGVVNLVLTKNNSGAEDGDAAGAPTFVAESVVFAAQTCEAASGRASGVATGKPLTASHLQQRSNDDETRKRDQATAVGDIDKKAVVLVPGRRLVSDADFAEFVAQTDVRQRLPTLQERALRLQMTALLPRIFAYGDHIRNGDEPSVVAQVRKLQASTEAVLGGASSHGKTCLETTIAKDTHFPRNLYRSVDVVRCVFVASLKHAWRCVLREDAQQAEPGVAQAIGDVKSPATVSTVFSIAGASSSSSSSASSTSGRGEKGGSGSPRASPVLTNSSSTARGPAPPSTLFRGLPGPDEEDLKSWVSQSMNGCRIDLLLRISSAQYRRPGDDAIRCCSGEIRMATAHRALDYSDWVCNDARLGLLVAEALSADVNVVEHGGGGGLRRSRDWLEACFAKVVEEIGGGASATTPAAALPVPKPTSRDGEQHVDTSMIKRCSLIARFAHVFADKERVERVLAVLVHDLGKEQQDSFYHPLSADTKARLKSIVDSAQREFALKSEQRFMRQVRRNRANCCDQHAQRSAIMYGEAEEGGQSLPSVSENVVVNASSRSSSSTTAVPWPTGVAQLQTIQEAPRRTQHSYEKDDGAWCILVGGEFGGTMHADRRRTRPGKYLGGHCSLQNVGRVYESLQPYFGKDRIIVITQLQETLDWLEQVTSSIEQCKALTGKEGVEFFNTMQRRRRETLRDCAALLENGGADYDFEDVNVWTLLNVLRGAGANSGLLSRANSSSSADCEREDVGKQGDDRVSPASERSGRVRNYQREKKKILPPRPKSVLLLINTHGNAHPAVQGDEASWDEWYCHFPYPTPPHVDHIYSVAATQGYVDEEGGYDRTRCCTSARDSDAASPLSTPRGGAGGVPVVSPRVLGSEKGITATPGSSKGGAVEFVLTGDTEDSCMLAKTPGGSPTAGPDEHERTEAALQEAVNRSSQQEHENAPVAPGAAGLTTPNAFSPPLRRCSTASSGSNLSLSASCTSSQAKRSGVKQKHQSAENRAVDWGAPKYRFRLYSQQLFQAFHDLTARSPTTQIVTLYQFCLSGGFANFFTLKSYQKYFDTLSWPVFVMVTSGQYEPALGTFASLYVDQLVRHLEFHKRHMLRPSSGAGGTTTLRELFEEVKAQYDAEHEFVSTTSRESDEGAVLDLDRAEQEVDQDDPVLSRLQAASSKAERALTRTRSKRRREEAEVEHGAIDQATGAIAGPRSKLVKNPLSVGTLSCHAGMSLPTLSMDDVPISSLINVFESFSSTRARDGPSSRARDELCAGDGFAASSSDDIFLASTSPACEPETEATSPALLGGHEAGSTSKL